MAGYRANNSKCQTKSLAGMSIVFVIGLILAMGFIQSANAQTNNAFVFPGNDSHVSVPHATYPQLAITGEITVEAWVYIVQNNVKQVIVSKRTGGSGDNGGYELRVNAANQLIFATYADNGQLKSSIQHSSTIPQFQWIHVSGGYKVTPQGQQRLFVTVDGFYQESNGQAPDDGVTDLQIARLNNNGTNDHFGGFLDSVRISTVGRYNGDFIPDCFPDFDGGVVALFRLNEINTNNLGEQTTPADTPNATQIIGKLDGNPLPYLTTGAPTCDNPPAGSINPF